MTATVETPVNAADLQEYRAYLQRGETRLSTLHRVAGAFLGGAGLLTLLPVLFRDTFSELFSELLFLPYPSFPPASAPQRWLMMFPVAVSLVLPLWALYALLRDLVRFYFTSHHFGAQYPGVSYPRFILSGIRVSDKSLSDPEPIRQARQELGVTELLVPVSAAARQRLLREAHLIGECRGLEVTSNMTVVQNKLREFMFKYTASVQRTLAQESAKMEASLARHNLLLRVLVLRYAKAFLLTILTTGITITTLVFLDLAAPARRVELVGDAAAEVVPGTVLWLGVLGVYAAWCPVAAFVVRRPVAWIYQELDDRNRSFRTPQSLLQFEVVTLASVAFASILTTASLCWFVLESQSLAATWPALVAGVALLGVTLVYVGRNIASGLRRDR
ncbi:hypothetical protein [Plantactinospora sp. KLBMP9567]|uniref:hypothetical protein n=1 Tax=Plantactinospora sp. KLBMP9567 TaxID=3085900 RepID=UPI002980A433|nr:hypothetical protein [Plantactinospora sp. KLBMP9567]MDW5323187.1 hypothetical protein [Plantactinospora sp. KLBMP9567]